MWMMWVEERMQVVQNGQVREVMRREVKWQRRPFSDNVDGVVFGGGGCWWCV